MARTKGRGRSSSPAAEAGKQRFEAAFPEGFFLDPSDPEGVERYAKRCGWLSRADSLLAVGKAGEGNMNLTLRLVTSSGSFILKQARPWVEKYPAIDAPSGRALVEACFYRTVASRAALRSAMPALLGSDPTSGVLALEDLGEAKDATALYRGDRLSEQDLESLSRYLVELHRPFESPDPLLRNRQMRALNHEHMFRLPLDPKNGPSLDAVTPGLEEVARGLREDGEYAERVLALGMLYLEDGSVLAHGDFFPGSWLSTPAGVRVIDPEFCFLGTASFDLGVAIAHLHLSRQPPALAEELVSSYRSRAAVDGQGVTLAYRFAGVEIMRRLIGVAQLPLNLGLEEKRELLARSRELVLSSRP